MGNWREVKAEVIKELDSAGVKDENARATILRFERRVNTTRNLLYNGYTWESICFSDSYNEASRILENELKDNRNHYGEKGKYADEFKSYCEANGTLPDAHLGDYLA